MSLGRIAHRSLCCQAMKLITSPLRKAAQLLVECSCCLNRSIHLRSPDVTHWSSFGIFRAVGQPGQGPDIVAAGVEGLGCWRPHSPIESDDADLPGRLDSSMGALVLSFNLNTIDYSHLGADFPSRAICVFEPKQHT